MKKIVDANFFQSPALLEYLKSGKNNFVIFPDYACMEAYKGNALINISKSIKIVSQFPEQIIVLKGTRAIVKLSLATSDTLQFVDPAQTKQFNDFCSMVKLAVEGDSILSEQIEKNGTLASKHFDKLLKDSQTIANGINKLTESFDSNQLSVLRKHESFDRKMTDKIRKDILFITALLFQEHPDIGYIPQHSVLPNSYILRYAVSNYILALYWVANGGTSDVKYEKMRNDIIDMHYVAYATFYDGILTKDKKMIQIYQKTCSVLRRFFGVNLANRATLE